MADKAFHLWGQQHAWLHCKEARTPISWAAAPVNESPLSCWGRGRVRVYLLNRKPCKPGIKRKPWWWQEAQVPWDRRCRPQWQGVQGGLGGNVLCFGRRFLASEWSLLRQRTEGARKCLCWFPETCLELADGGLASGTSLPSFLLAIWATSYLQSAQASFSNSKKSSDPLSQGWFFAPDPAPFSHFAQPCWLFLSNS